MKKLRLALILLLLTLLLTPAALADLIVEPRDDFYETHAEECQYQPRDYTANGSRGYTTVWANPTSNRQIENLPNGSEFHCTHLYPDGAGEVWGLCATGWVRLSDCLAVPDYLTFQQAHGDEFVSYDSTYDHVFDQLETVVLWRYPGSGVAVIEALDTDRFRNIATPAEAFSQCYTAPDGSFWGCVPYSYGVRNAWLCLSDPGNTALSAIDGILPESEVVIPPPADIPGPNAGISWLAVGLVAALVVVTAILIPVVCRRKKA